MKRKPRRNLLIEGPFHRLTPIEEIPGDNGKPPMYLCRCECGKLKIVSYKNLIHHEIKSCGCLQREHAARQVRKMNKSNRRHDLRGTGVYKTWRSMMTRCYSPSHDQYQNYGARGIKVCKRWHNPVNFAKDMGERPNGKTIDRKDNDGDYCPENCKWSTQREQNLNRRCTIYIEFNGLKLSLVEWAERLGVCYVTLFGRKSRGWSVEKILTTPVRKKLFKSP